MRNIIFNLQKLENFTALLLLVFIFSWYFNTEMPSIESKMIEEGLKEFFLFIIQEEKCMEWKQFYSLLWWQWGRELLEEGRIPVFQYLKALNIWVVMILWKLNISENFDPFLLCNSLIVLKSYCWNAIYPTKNKRSQTFFFNPRQMDIKETSYAMQVTKTQIQINIL